MSADVAAAIKLCMQVCVKAVISQGVLVDIPLEADLLMPVLVPVCGHRRSREVRFHLLVIGLYICICISSLILPLRSRPEQPILSTHVRCPSTSPALPLVPAN